MAVKRKVYKLSLRVGKSPGFRYSGESEEVLAVNSRVLTVNWISFGAPIKKKSKQSTG